MCGSIEAHPDDPGIGALGGDEGGGLVDLHAGGVGRGVGCGGDESRRSSVPESVSEDAVLDFDAGPSRRSRGRRPDESAGEVGPAAGGEGAGAAGAEVPFPEGGESVGGGIPAEMSSGKGESRTAGRVVFAPRIPDGMCW